MAILTVATLKTLWINGFIPTQNDYTDLFDTMESLSSSGGASPTGLEIESIMDAYFGNTDWRQTNTNTQLSNAEVVSAVNAQLGNTDWQTQGAGGATPVFGAWINLSIQGDATANRLRYRVKGNTVELDIYLLRMNSVLAGSGKIAFMPAAHAPADRNDSTESAIIVGEGRISSQFPQVGTAVLRVNGDTGSTVNSYALVLSTVPDNYTSDSFNFRGTYEIR